MNLGYINLLEIFDPTIYFSFYFITVLKHFGFMINSKNHRKDLRLISWNR